MATIARYVGVKEEASYATEATGSAIDLIDSVISPGLDVPKDPNIELPTLNRFAQRHIAGYYSPEGDIEANVDVQSVGWFLKWALGGYKFTAGTESTPNTHEFYAAQTRHDVTSFTTRIGKDTFEHVFLGCVINKFNLSVDKELANIKWNILAQKDKKATLRDSNALNTLDPDLFPLAFYNATTKFAGTDVSALVKSWELAYENGIKADDKQGQGSRYPYGFIRRDGSTELTVEKNTEDISDELELFWGDAAGSVQEQQTPFAVETLFDSADFGNMKVQAPQCTYKEVPSSYKGADPIAPKLGIRLEAAEITLADTTTTVLSPILITLKNYDAEYKLPVVP